MTAGAPSQIEELRSKADDAFERGDFEAARSLYRQLAGGAFTRADLGELISTERHSMRLLLRTTWQQTDLWFVGAALADLVAPDDEAFRILGEIVARTELDPRERWRVRCKLVSIALDRGPHRAGLPGDVSWTDIVEEFLTAWRYLEELGEAAAVLRKGMGQMLVRAGGPNARDFLTTLQSHSRMPPALRLLVSKKIEELPPCQENVGRSRAEIY